MTYEATYLKSNALHSDLIIQIKRIDSSGTYETNWQDISSLIANPSIVQDSIPSMSYKLENESYSYGVVRVPDCTLKLLSLKGEFDSEDNSSSIFYGYVRHKSLIKISHGYLDERTGSYDYIEVYRGFINEKSDNTKASNDNTCQNLFVEDLLTFLLKEYTFSDFTLTETTLEAFLYELFNRSEFTDFLTVSASNIEAGYDIQNIDTAAVEGQTQWLRILQDLSIGHSHLYQREGVLYYKPIEASANQKYFGRDKIIKFDEFSTGINEVFEELYWEDGLATFIADPNLYGQTKTFDIKTITDETDRVNILATIGTRTSKVRKKFKVLVILFVDIFILDLVQLIVGDYETENDFIWDQNIWDDAEWSQNIGAAATDSANLWMVKEVKHNFKDCTTELIVESVS